MYDISVFMEPVEHVYSAWSSRIAELLVFIKFVLELCLYTVIQISTY